MVKCLIDGNNGMPLARNQPTQLKSKSMKTVTLEIKNCKACPFASFYPVSPSNQKEYGACFAPHQIHDGNYTITSAYKEYKRPNWCPLKENKLIIKG